MQMTPGKYFRLALPLMGLALMGWAAPAYADDCSTILNAVLAVSKTPYSATIANSGPQGAAGTDQVIFTGSMMYLQSRGTWHALPMTGKEIADEAIEKSKTTKQTCQRMGDESVGGEAATIFSSYSETEAGKVDSRIWISKSRGLALKTEVHLPALMMMVETFKYGSVQPPAGVKPLGTK
jgi:hypothetical protein